MRKPGENRRTIAPIHAIILLSGFTFLVYEVSWNRLLSLLLGSTVSAATIVLSSFMAGFGLGAFFWGRTANTARRCRRLLALVLGGMGVLGGLSAMVVSRAVPQLYASLAGSGLPAALAEVLVFAVAAGLLFIAAFLMGGVFPLVSGIAVRATDSIASCLGRLYALETLGSTLGGLATGFLLLGTLGQRKTIELALGINLLLALWLLLAQRDDLGLHASEPASTGPRRRQGAGSGDAPRTAGPGSTILRRAALTGALVCGFAILSLQVFWMRILRTYMTNTSYSFALVSSIAILGLCGGSALFQRRGRNIADHRNALFVVLVLMGVCTTAGLILLVRLPQILMFPFEEVFGKPLARVLLLPCLASLLVVLPPAAFSGYAFPLTCRMYVADKGSIGRDVGLVLMVNTFGSVCGPILAAFVLLPILGAATSILLIAVLLVGVAFCLRKSGSSRRSRRMVYGAGLATVVVLAALLFDRPTIRILPPSFSRFDREVLYYRESVEGTLSVGQDRGVRPGAKYTYVNNSAVIGSSYDAIKVVKMVGHTPFLLGLECRDVLVIGFGIGVTTAAIASHPEVASIECVELVTGLRDAAAYYRDLNHDIVADPRLTIIAGDGRHHLQRTAKMYDLISCDPTHPILGSGNLYTREYFALCRRHLNPRGMVAQYLPLHKLRPEEFLGIIKTFHAAFPHATVWLGHYHAVLLGSLEPLSIDFAEWTARASAIERDPHFYADPYHLAANLVWDSETIADLTAGHRINTDDLSYTEFFAPACLDAANIGRNLSLFMDRRSDVTTVFFDIPDPPRMARYVAGNRLLTQSLDHKLRGENQRALQLLRQACEVNPEDQEFPFLISLYYGR